MANPLLTNNKNVGIFKLLKDFKNNPQQVINNNPQLQSVLAMYKGDAKTAFYALCKQKNIDPNTILNQLK